jgi:hypothetical protein
MQKIIMMKYFNSQYNIIFTVKMLRLLEIYIISRMSKLGENRARKTFAHFYSYINIL